MTTTRDKEQLDDLDTLMPPPAWEAAADEQESDDPNHTTHP